MGDDLIQLIEGYPFPIALRNAAEMRWSGILRVMRGVDQVGVLVMRDGHVAWAVSSSQAENFGGFLERIGMIPKEKLDEIISKYRALGKTKKLGMLLEESGLISHATLRECLKAHLRAAISSMMADPLITLEARHGEMAIDAGLVFMLNEVYPVSDETSTPAETEATMQEVVEETHQAASGSRESEILRDFSTMPGYLYSFVADMSGRVTAVHSSDDVALKADHLVPAVVGWLSTSSLRSAGLEMGKVEFAFVQCETGSLFVHLAGTDAGHFLAVACNDDARLGVVRHKMSEVMTAVRRLADFT